MSNKRLDSRDFTIEGEKPIPLGEIKDVTTSGAGIEIEQVIGPNAHQEALAYEAFMNEMVTIELAETIEEGALPVITVGVNGINQPIVRGYATPVKRKYVEVLARAKETKYRQEQINPYDPSSIEMVPKTALSYPFTVVKDSAEGFAWLREILKQPA